MLPKGKISRSKLCKTCRVPFVPDADVGTDDLTAEGCGAWSCVQGLAAVKRHGQVCADGSLGGLTRIGADAAGQIDGQHECARFPADDSSAHRQPVRPGEGCRETRCHTKHPRRRQRAVLPALPHRGIW